jgi:hypothetical protein
MTLMIRLPVRRFGNIEPVIIHTSSYRITGSTLLFIWHSQEIEPLPIDGVCANVIG